MNFNLRKTLIELFAVILHNEETQFMLAAEDSSCKVHTVGRANPHFIINSAMAFLNRAVEEGELSKDEVEIIVFNWLKSN